jgi:metal-responsive CopG/Arc/MetJ family transcriptional regulator
VRVKTSITLSGEILERIDRTEPNRSKFVEQAALHYLAMLERSRRDAQDAAILEANARRLNREADDVLQYQDLP